MARNYLITISSLSVGYDPNPMYMNMENNDVHLNSDSDEASPHSDSDINWWIVTDTSS
jgi:hypothetical protein